MPPKKEILGNILLKVLIAIRTDTLWRMLSLLKQDQLPGPNEEGATGKLDNKGAIFIPGGLVHQDIDPPYGSRTRISTCVSIGLTDPHVSLLQD